MSTMAQQLLGYAHKRITLPDRQKTAFQKNYRTAVRNAPTLIKTAGLAQAIAFMATKTHKPNEPGYRALLTDIEELPNIDKLIKVGGADLLPSVCRLETAEYMLLTRRVLEGLTFLKRMAEAYYPPNDVEVE